MKKLLVLTMVLGIASLASAGFAVVVAGDSMSLTLSGDFVDSFTSAYCVSVGGTVTTAMIYDQPGSGAGPTTDPDALDFLNDAMAGKGVTSGIQQYLFLEFNDTAEPFVYPTGNLAVLTADTPVTVYLFDGEGGDIGTFSLVPEPATMLLLGLGGLFLRRRK